MQSTTRRQFLGTTGRVLVVVPAGYAIGQLVIACSSSSGECDNAGDVDSQTDRIVFTSSCGNNHVHDFTLMRATVATPPTNGLHQETSSYEGDHTHVIDLSVDELVQIQGGQTVTKTSSVVKGHTHSFDFALEDPMQ